ncbi:MAG: GntR family transcriptional regulator [Gemmatimonadetes bacterium]|nr:GntR family transcriptional regulator [Gemmatimonadota bacterium]
MTVTLRRAIREGVLIPGKRLTQQEIADQLGVSRIPLRDALRRLEVESLVEIDGHKGARVTVLTAEAISEIYEIRIALETICIGHAIANLTEESAAELALDSMASADDTLTPSEAFNRRRDFYERLYKYANRPRMYRIIMQLRNNVDRYHMLADRGHAHFAHTELAEAIVDRDADRATKILIAHISEARDDLVRNMNTSS